MRTAALSLYLGFSIYITGYTTMTSFSQTIFDAIWPFVRTNGYTTHIAHSVVYNALRTQGHGKRKSKHLAGVAMQSLLTNGVLTVAVKPRFHQDSFRKGTCTGYTVDFEKLSQWVRKGRLTNTKVSPQDTEYAQTVAFIRNTNLPDTEKVLAELMFTRGRDGDERIYHFFSSINKKTASIDTSNTPYTLGLDAITVNNRPLAEVDVRSCFQATDYLTNMAAINDPHWGTILLQGKMVQHVKDIIARDFQIDVLDTEVKHIMMLMMYKKQVTITPHSDYEVAGGTPHTKSHLFLIREVFKDEFPNAWKYYRAQIRSTRTRTIYTRNTTNERKLVRDAIVKFNTMVGASVAISRHDAILIDPLHLEAFLKFLYKTVRSQFPLCPAFKISFNGLTHFWAPDSHLLPPQSPDLPTSPHIIGTTPRTTMWVDVPDIPIGIQ
jgi:hypothetical protein